jgi:hypothetical protein
MSEGNTTPDNGTQIATVEPAQGQGSYVLDAFDDYMESPEAVSELKGHPADVKKPEDVAQKKPEVVKKQPEPAKAEDGTKKPEVKPEVKTGPQIDPLETAFSGEDGQFDLQSFTSYALPEIPDGKPLDLGLHTEGKTEEIPEWKKAIQEDQEQAQNMRTAVQSITGTIRDLVARGSTPEQAIAQVLQEYEKHISDHMNEQAGKREELRMNELEKRAIERERQATITENARTNTNAIIQSLPGKTYADKTATFNAIMFKAGEPILEREFLLAHPEVKNLTPEQRRPVAQKFLNDLLSNKDDLRFVFERAMDRDTRARLPKLLEISRMAKAAEIKSKNLSAQKTPGGTIQRPQTKPGKSSDPWAGYFSSHEEMADRV